MKRNEIIVHEHKKGVRAVKYNQKPQTTIEPPKPRNPVAKNAGAAIGGGAAGAHKDKKKAAKQGDVKHKAKALDMAEGFGRRSSYYNPMDDERDQQRQMDYDKREFKRQELQHELGHERNNIQVVINGKKWKVFPGKGYADSPEERMNLRKMQQWADNKSASTGKKWEVYLTGASPSVDEAGQEVGKISKVDPMTKKATVTKSDGSSMEVDSSELKPTPDGKMQMDVPDSDEMKSGTPVVSTESSTEEEMMVPPTDSSSPIAGDNDHDEVSKLLVRRLRRLAGL